MPTIPSPSVLRTAAVPADVRVPRRVVLDTNVVVAAGFRPRSASGRLVEAVRGGEVAMAWSDETRREIERIVGRIRPLRAFDLASLFRAEERWVEPLDPGAFSIVADADDRKFAALAHATGATLATSDEHLLVLRGRPDLLVVTPGELRERWWRLGR